MHIYIVPPCYSGSIYPTPCRAFYLPREYPREGIIIFLFFIPFFPYCPFFSPVSRDVNIVSGIPEGGGIETFRNSDCWPLVSHATHQLNANVCLCVRREPRTFIDVRALSPAPSMCTVYRSNCKIAEKRQYAALFIHWRLLFEFVFFFLLRVIVKETTGE